MLKISYFHTLMTLLKTMLDINLNAASVHRCHGPGRPAAAFLSICVINDTGDKWHERLCMGIRVKI